MKCEVFDLVCKVGSNEVFFAEGVGLFVVFEVGHHELHLLCDVGAFLVILSVAVDICEESPVIEVVDCILKEGVHCLVTPKVMTEPGGEWLHWFVSGIIRRGI